ncbi:hypothetical protein BAMBUS_03730 [Brevundimonas phage vB_BpoS-Bambus]|nr:hypothetical protein BAMBUS_03730 [Brevundimonas phage vB_BpoS-Bambus]
MSAQAIHLLALIVLFPTTIASFVWFLMAWGFRGGFGVTWRSVILSGGVFLSLFIALGVVLYHPYALPNLLSGIVLPPNPFKVS